MHRFSILLKIVFSLFVGANVAQAETRNFILDCDNDRKWPSGVPATLTKYENLRVFREWCDAAGTSSLHIAMKHDFEMRALEGLGLPESAYSNDTKIIGAPLMTEATSSEELAAFVETLPKVPAAGFKYTLSIDYNNILSITKIEAYYAGKNTKNNQFFNLDEQSDYSYRTNSTAYVDGDILFSYKSQYTDSVSNELCAYLNDSRESSSTKGHCEFKVKHKYIKKKTCKPHSSYIFLNLISNEITSNFIDGGSCYRYKGGTFVAPDQGQRLEYEVVYSVTNAVSG